MLQTRAAQPKPELQSLTGSSMREIRTEIRG